MTVKKKKVKLIEKLLTDGWFQDERTAKAWALERKILVDNKPIISVSERVSTDCTIRVKEHYKLKYVSKGGLKLEGAIEDFKIDVTGMIALDCGASTGGFTDCLLAHGASYVYAVDVGYGQIAGKLLHSTRVVNLERTNLSDCALLSLEPRPNIITLDLSYLSLKKAVPICRKILGEKGYIIALIKPLFEVESSAMRQQGIIEDPITYKNVLLDLCHHFLDDGLSILGLTYSHVRGNSNTIEYFIYLSLNNPSHRQIFENDYEEYIDNLVAASLKLGQFRK